MTSEDNREIELVGTRYKALEGVLSTSLNFLCTFVATTKRPFRYPRTQIVALNSLDSRTPLDPGQGLIILYLKGYCTHGVVLWRGEDGEFIFFDSNSWPAPKEVDQYVRAKGYPSYSVMPCAIQSPGIRSCGYHCLAFVDFVSRNPQIPTSELPHHYPPKSYCPPDVAVVHIVEEMCTEVKRENKDMMRIFKSHPNLTGKLKMRVRRPWRYATSLVQDLQSAVSIAARVKKRGRSSSSDEPQNSKRRKLV